MFRQLINRPPRIYPDAATLFAEHPLTLAALAEQVWYAQPTRSDPPTFPTLNPFTVNPLIGAPANSPFNSAPPLGGAGGWPNLLMPFEHLIYAYMVENTRIYDIFRRVVTEYRQGERLGRPSRQGQQWLRVTEELFFRDTPPFFLFTLTSQLRPDANAIRRNAYYRLFGLDLNHGTDDNQAYPYVKPTAANQEFVPTLELLLTEVWRGITNATNTSGAKDTDDDAIATLALRLHDMLTVRKDDGGNLQREEFWFTAMMSWFHLTVEDNTPIIVDLRADATSPEERLRKVGERVGLPSHSRSQAFFQLADAMSLFLLGIEANSYSDPTTAKTLYNPPIQDNMVRIITQYSVATGRDIKARTVVPQRR